MDIAGQETLPRARLAADEDVGLVLARSLDEGGDGLPGPGLPEEGRDRGGPLAQGPVGPTQAADLEGLSEVDLEFLQIQPGLVRK